jgi:hypothetical protein
MAQKTVWEAASRLLANSKVAARVKELQELAKERTLVTMESITRELEEVRAAAVNGKEYAPAVSAIMGKAKVNGLLVDKAELTGKNGGAIEAITKIELVAPDICSKSNDNIQS